MDFGVGCVSKFTVNAPSSGNQFEAQYLRSMSFGSLVAGIGGYRILTTQENLFSDPCQTLNNILQARDRGLSTYIAAIISMSETVRFHLGLSQDSVQVANLKVSKTSPKIGVTFRLSPATVLRAAAFRSVKPTLLASQTLQPSHVVGFTEYFDDTNGSISDSAAIAVDTNLRKDFFIGGEVGKRKTKFWLNVFNDPTFTKPETTTANVYFNWTPTTRTSVAAQYRREELTLPRQDAEEAGFPNKIRTERLPISIKYHLDSGFTAGLILQWVRQRIEVPEQEHSNSSFSLVDALLSYRLAGRRLTLSLEIRNLLDRRFAFQDTSFLAAEPVNPPFIPARNFRANLSFHF